MAIITKQSQIPEASTSDLVATYNALTGKTITRFSSRGAGEAQVANAILSAENRAGQAGVQKGQKPTARPLAEATPKAEGDRGRRGHPASRSRKSEPALKKLAAQVTKLASGKTAPAKRPPSDASSAIRKTWNDAEVRAARSLKQRVKADGQEYRSVREAFTALKLPDSKHVKFRMELKAAGSATFSHEGKGHKFHIVEAR